MSAFVKQSLFSALARERCMNNLRNVRIPKYDKQPDDKAAVLVPLCSAGDDVSLLYTLRSNQLRNYSGHISFPGGKCDPNETVIDTALREVREEIGLSAHRISIWGEGPTFPGRDNRILITPVLASIEDLQQHDLAINTSEVAEVFTITLETLCDPKNQYHTQFKNGFILPVFAVEEYRIWGVTAFITHAVLSSLLPRDVYKNEWLKKKIDIADLSYKDKSAEH